MKRCIPKRYFDINSLYCFRFKFKDLTVFLHHPSVGPVYTLYDLTVFFEYYEYRSTVIRVPKHYSRFRIRKEVERYINSILS